jgi:hypothetical protein
MPGAPGPGPFAAPDVPANAVTCPPFLPTIVPFAVANSTAFCPSPLRWFWIRSMNGMLCSIGTTLSGTSCA